MSNSIAEARAKIKIVECGEKMVTLSQQQFLLEPLYFMWGFAEKAALNLREGVFEKLLRINERALAKGFRLKIWDCFRTYKTQSILYEGYFKQLKTQFPHFLEEDLHRLTQEFVAFPSKNPMSPAPHNTGGAIDLTLTDLAGNELLMGTRFDEFNVRAHTLHFENGGTPEEKMIHENRMLLLNLMEEEDFVNYSGEWWHFSFGDQSWALLKGKEHAIYASTEF